MEALLARAQATSGSPEDPGQDTRGRVNFPQFVTGLIEGVFHAVVNASARQMEAYPELVASVADP